MAILNKITNFLDLRKLLIYFRYLTYSIADVERVFMLRPFRKSKYLIYFTNKSKIEDLIYFYDIDKKLVVKKSVFSSI